ncbi:MAG: RDD family protein [Gemmatimonadota bacterium]|jgi:uncharacterized RDD family membrane protein YckC
MPLLVESAGTMTEAAIHPWRRYFARSLDYAIAGAVVGAVIGLFDTSFFNNDAAGLFMAVLTMALWVPFEAVLLAMYGTTPGKAYMKLRVTPLDSEDPAPFDTTLARALRVWFGGMACGVPLLSVIAMLIGYESLRSRGETWWDRQLELAVRETGPLGVGRVFGLILIFGGLVALALVR